MKKELQVMVEAIRVTKRYTEEEVQKLGKLFLYLNSIEGLMNEYKYGVSAKGLRKLLNPLTRNDKVQAFDDWRQSVSNISRLKEGEDYIKQTKLSYQNIVNDGEVTISEISEIQKRKKKSGVIPIKDSDYILTYCMTTVLS